MKTIDIVKKPAFHSRSGRFSACQTHHEDDRDHGPDRPSIRRHSDDGSHLFGLAHARSIQKNGLSHCHSCFAGLSYALFAIIISGIASPLSMEHCKVH